MSPRDHSYKSMIASQCFIRACVFFVRLFHLSSCGSSLARLWVAEFIKVKFQHLTIKYSARSCSKRSLLHHLSGLANYICIIFPPSVDWFSISPACAVLLCFCVIRVSKFNGKSTAKIFMILNSLIFLSDWELWWAAIYELNQFARADFLAGEC